MVRDRIPSPVPSADQSDFESMEVKVPRYLNFDDVMTHISANNRITFIVTRDLDILITTDPNHHSIESKLELSGSDILFDSGHFQINPNSRKIEFEYSGRIPDALHTAKRAAELKIKDFLRSKGLQIQN